MSQVVTMFTSDDAGAPQLANGKPSEIINILTKCLVDGYGAKTPLGWTRPYYDAGVQAVVFRNNPAVGGSGGYAKIYSNDASDSNGVIMRITHAVSMTGLNDFFNQGFTQAFRAQQAGIPKNKWVLIGTGLAFYFFINRNTSSLQSSGEEPIMFVGDFYSSLASDAGRFITLTNPTTGDSAAVSADTLTIIPTGQISTNNVNLKIYDADGHPTSNNHGVWRTAPLIEFAVQTGFNIEITSEHILMPVAITRTSYDIDSPNTDRLGTLLHISNISPSFRGVFPGLSLSLKPGYQQFAWPVIREISNQDHLLFRNYQSGPCNMWLNLEVWNDPFGNV